MNTGRKVEAKALIAYCLQTLHLAAPSAIVALTRALAIILDELPDKERQQLVTTIEAVLHERNFPDKDEWLVRH